MNKALRAARERLELTQAEVAAAAKISEVGYQNIELGKSDPKMKTLSRIAAVLEISIDEAIGGDDRDHSIESP